jgi:hypothetical protein
MGDSTAFLGIDPLQFSGVLFILLLLFVIYLLLPRGFRVQYFGAYPKRYAWSARTRARRSRTVRTLMYILWNGLCVMERDCWITKMRFKFCKKRGTIIIVAAGGASHCYNPITNISIFLFISFYLTCSRWQDPQRARLLPLERQLPILIIVSYKHKGLD